MKFNIFSKKEKKDKGASIKATDFLNPRDGDINDSKEPKKKEAVKEEKAVSKKELRRIEKEKKLEAKKLAKEEEKREKEEEKIKKAQEKERKIEEEKEENKRLEQERKEEKEQKDKEYDDKLLKEKEKKDKKSKDVKKDDVLAKTNLQEQELVETKEQFEKDDKTTKPSKVNHDFEKSNILEINLVKDEINVYFDWYKNIAMLIIFVFLSFVLILEIYLALSWWQSKNDSAVSQEEARFVELSVETKKIRGEAEEALNFQTKLNRANYVLDNHLYWSNFFDYLEKNTLENVQYITFEGDILGNFSIPAISDNFPSLGQQIYQLQSDSNTIKASISSGEKLESKEESVEEIEFEINLQVSRELFKK